MSGKRILALVVLVSGLSAGCQSREESAARQEEPETVARTLGEIERVDPRFDAIVPEGAQIELLADGLDWSEGPVWIKDGNYLLFSDVPQNTVLKWAPGQEKSVFLRPSGYTGEGSKQGSNGLAVDGRGRLVLCQHGDRRVAVHTSENGFETLVAEYEGKRLNSPNDLVFKSNGDLYFTDPPYGLEGRDESPEKELSFNGVYRYSARGELTLLVDDLTFPNGLAFAPDEKTLYVAVSDPENPVIMAYDVNAEGLLEDGRVFYDTRSWMEGRKGLPDGMKVDQAGNLFATGPGGVNVFTADGDFLGRFNTGEATANCAWGDDGSTLYMTADSYLCRVRLSTSGFTGWSDVR